MSAQDVQKEVAAALSREEPLSEAECNALLAELTPLQQAAGERLLRITPGDGLHPMGAEYKRAMQSGTVEEVKAIKDEAERVKIESDQLAAQRSELLSRRSAARIRESFEGLPGLQSTLVDHLTAAEQARAAFEAALDAVENSYQAVTRARGQCHVGGYAGEPADPHTIARLMALAPFSGQRRVSMQADAGRHRENLGHDHLTAVAA